MAYLHNNKDQFQDAIELAYEQTGIMAQAIEKDYYVTMLLRLLSEKMPYIVFKGGTSLSKCHKVIKRFFHHYERPQIQLTSAAYPFLTALSFFAQKELSLIQNSTIY